MGTATSAGDPVDRALAPGDEVGPYRIVALIGRGGMGEVFEARHVRVGQRAALKVLAAVRRREVGASAVRRFMTEVEALSRLEHPGLVRVLDCGDAPAHGPWIAMELVPGEVLRARIERGPMSLAAGLRAARRIASAVAAIHGAGIVHRDLKPDNIMVTPDDEVPGGERVKLLDFGIAKLSGEVQHTTEGTALGTAGYMSPEQCTGDRDLDGAADVYALGVIVFELTTGARPFTGDAQEVMRQHLFVEPPLDRFDQDVPDELVELARVMLAKEPSRRPAIADVVRRLRALETSIAGAPEAEPGAALAATVPAPAIRTVTGHRRAAQEVAPEVAPAAAPRARHRARWIAAALAAAALAATGVVLARRAAAPRSAPRAPALRGMIVVPGARFQMGSTREELEAACRDLPGGCLDAEWPQLERELPARTVTVTTFQLDVHEVTNREYAAFLTNIAGLVEVRPDRDDHYPRFVSERGVALIDLHPTFGGITRTADGFTVEPARAELPVVQVTWDGASRYCRHRGKRLPTEAEWELAARGAEHRRFPWGGEPPRCDGVVFGRGDSRGCPDLPNQPAAVETAAQDVTASGLHDLGGNVGEWVQDRFGLAYYGSCGECKDPVVDDEVPLGDDSRIFRGGNFRGVAWFSRTTTRSRWKRAEVMNGIGFRCATR